MSKPNKRRKHGASSFRLETFLINYGLQFAGGLLILGSLVYLLMSNFNTHYLTEFLNSFTKSAPEKSLVELPTASSLSGYLSLLLFLPGILVLISSYFLRNMSTGPKKILFSFGFIWLIISFAKVLLDIRSHSIELNYYLILVCFCIIQLLATSISIAVKSRFALTWSVVYFFVSIILIRLIYGVIIPNIIFLICIQILVSVFCFRYNWRSLFILLMTLSSVYISYYFIKLIILAGGAPASVHFLLPGLFTWFILAAAGFGIFKPGPERKTVSFIWETLPYFTLALVTALYLTLYFQSGINYLSVLYFTLTVIALILIGVFDRKYEFLKFKDPFYSMLCVFSAFLLPQFFQSDFFLVLAASLAVTLLVNVLFTDLKVSFHVSLGLLFVTLGLYLVDWAFTIIPALAAQRVSGAIYPLNLVLRSLLLFALAWFYSRLFARLIAGYAFSHSKTRSYKSSVGTAHHIILYLTGFLIFDYSLILLIPGYRVNLIEWSFYSLVFMDFLLASGSPKSRTKLRYAVVLSLLAILLYPLAVHPETIHFRTLYLAGNTSALIPFLMHYLSLGVIIHFILRVNTRLRLLYPKSLLIANIKALLGIVFLCFLLLSEYDHILLLSMDRLSNQSAYEILQYNKFIPYSVILLSVSVILFIFSLIYYTRFLRRLSMLMILAVLLKVLFIDITILSANKSIILLISLGVILLASSFLIPRLGKQSKMHATPVSNPVEQFPETGSEK